MKKVVQILCLLALVPACVPTGPAAQGGAATRGSAEAITFAPVVTDRGGYCMVGFTVTYPEGVAPHKRSIRIREHALENTIAYDLPIPPLGAPRQFSRAGGMVTFGTLGEATIDGCRPELTRRSLVVGQCAEGDCPPVRIATGTVDAQLGLTARAE